MKFPILGIALSILVGAAAPSGHAAVFGSYTPDANTLHLWHLDDINGLPLNAPTNAANFDAISNNPQTSPLIMSNVPGQVNQSGFTGYPANNFALQGQPAFTNASAPFINFGYSVMTTNFSCLLPAFIQTNPLLANVIWTAGTNLSDFINTNTGAFTFEAMVRPQVNPLTAGRNMEIICGDSGFAFRAWQFRINTAGKLEFNININAPSTWVHDVSVALPSTGPDAVAAGNWYHVAVTCTGNAPTNGDQTAQVKLYWTLVDVTRTNADVLLTTNITFGSFTNIAVPLLGIGGSARGSPVNNVGNSEGFIGNIDEVRISSVCRKSNEMIFNTSVFTAPPIISIVQTNLLVGYGQTLAITGTETGTTPITNQWFQNGVALPGQTNSVLTISNITFAGNGQYQLFATNAAGPASSVICSVTVGASFNGLFNTGVDANGNPTPANGAVDLHYTLTQSANPALPGPNAIDLGPGAQPTGAASGGDSVSEWLAASTSGNGTTGTYSYQTLFQLDNGDIPSAVLSGNVLACGPHGGEIVQAFLNGVETDITLAPNPISTVAPFVITNGLQAGSNVLVFSMNSDGGNTPAGSFRIHAAGIGNALPAGLPSFNTSPGSQTVQLGATVVLPVVALGRPPLSYQWLSNGVPISSSTIASATSQYLTFVATNINTAQISGGNFTANYQVVVSNDSGAVTSAVAPLTIQVPPLTVLSAGEPIWEASANTTNIVVNFSQAVDPVTASAAGNYSLNNGSTVLSAAPGDAPNKVVLTTSVLTPSVAYTLTVQNVQSYLGLTMSPTPASLAVGIYPALALWLKAGTGITTDANGVTQWNDLSGNGNNMTSFAPYEPLLATNSTTGDVVVRFNATNGAYTYMSANDSSSLAITNDITILAVVNFATLSGNTNGMIVSKTTGNQPSPYDYYSQSSNVRLLRGNGVTSAVVASSAAPTTGVEHLLDVTMQGTNVTHRLDGQPNGVGTLSSIITDDSSQPLTIGTRVDLVNHLTGDIAELIIVGSALSSGDMASMETYLAAAHQIVTFNVNPTNIVVSPFSGGQFTLSWPQDHTGWQLQSNSIGLAVTNAWFTVPGSTTTNQITITPSAAAPSVFYRLLH